LSEKIDLLIVDGPPGSKTEMSRYPAVPFLMDRKLLAEDYSIFLDDTQRYYESKILDRWSEEIGQPKVKHLKYGVIASDNKFNTRPYFHGHSRKITEYLKESPDWLKEKNRS
jgi:hypothetical protein